METKRLERELGRTGKNWKEKKQLERKQQLEKPEKELGMGWLGGELLGRDIRGMIEDKKKSWKRRTRRLRRPGGKCYTGKGW